MKLFLIIPEKEKLIDDFFPAGICYISAALKRIEDFEVININLNFPHTVDPLIRLEKLLEEERPPGGFEWRYRV